MQQKLSPAVERMIEAERSKSICEHTKGRDLVNAKKREQLEDEIASMEAIIEHAGSNLALVDPDMVG